MEEQLYSDTGTRQNYLDELTYKTIGCAIEVHRQIGAGLSEAVYEACFAKELMIQDMAFEKLGSLPVAYKGIEMDSELRMHFLIEELLIVELKTVSRFLPHHQASILTCMKLLEKPKAVIFNFNAHNIVKEGHRVFFNKYYPQPS
jgi:GxxExxY protein